jgi:hypothetical protein
MVYVNLSTGAFAVGDKSASGKVTYFGNRWPSSNSLTGGAPISFKGYAMSISASPPACGNTFTTRPGYTTGAPRTAPSYLAVMVTSKVTAAGSTLTGNVVKIVIVKTDAVSNLLAAGANGTGQVVATLCSAGH